MPEHILLARLNWGVFGDFRKCSRKFKKVNTIFYR